MQHEPAADVSSIDYLLVDGFSMMAFVAATEPLRIANRIAERPLYGWRVVSETGAPIAASNGMRVLPDISLDQATPAARFAVCSGFLNRAPLSEALRRRLCVLGGAGVTLGGIDTGCFALAEAGLLDGHTVTLHWESLPAFRERFPFVHAVESLYELGDQRFSCAGGMAATDMALAELAAEHGAAVADAVAEQLIHERAREPSDRQRHSIVKRLGVHNTALVRAIALMETQREPPLTIDEIARRIGRSPRQLQRLFDAELGTTPRAWYRDLRLDRARALVEETDRPLAEIAVAAGFAAGSSFARAFRQRHGAPPSALR